MIIFGNTPKDWKRKFLNNKWLIASYVVMFMLGALIF